MLNERLGLAALIVTAAATWASAEGVIVKERRQVKPQALWTVQSTDITG
jgi:hypothetical protein